MPHAIVNRARLYYELFDDQTVAGPPVLFHHGYTSSHDSWRAVLDRLRHRHRCIAMDCRGAGDSEHTEHGYTIAEMAADVVGIANHLGLDRFAYVGHSMGGVIGMELGLVWADRLDKLILVAPAPADGMQLAPDERARRRQLWRARARQQLIDERMVTGARELGREIIAAAVDRALSVSERHHEECWKALRDVRLGHRLGEITTPTLVVSAAADAMLTSNLDDFRRLPNATLHVFSRVGHTIQRELPDELAVVLDDFLHHGVVTAQTLQARLTV
ncbi:MAG: alpha/beta hydrolase [Proteobacteria bacterium]|nr:alpha/beta hydrolase [Pseudomonadota bacterium]